MARKYIDCREVPSEMNCTVAIAADSEDELVEAAVQHAMAGPLPRGHPGASGHGAPGGQGHGGRGRLATGKA